MQIQDECYPCILRLMAGIARAGLPPEQAGDFLRELEGLPAFAERSYPATPAHLVAEVWPRLVTLSGEPDPLREVRKKQNEMARSLLPAARGRIARGGDPLDWALRFAIAGNKLDAMVGVAAVDPADFLQFVEAQALDPEAVAVLRERLGRAKSVLYFGDNCGEVVLDRLLLEVLRDGDAASRELTYVTRSLPMANDALVEDALEAGIDELARVIPNGIGRPFPGTDLEEVSEEVRTLAASADVVISKGLANYETLSEEPSLVGRITFLVEAKCAPICRVQQAPRGSLIICNA